jgi:hypothetical protein
MPAVELGRLQQQVAQISDLFQQPAEYLLAAENLLRDHGMPVHRQGRVKGLRPILVSYEVPPPLLRLLAQEMSAQAREHATDAVAIADGLWSRPVLETRQLAISLLGSIEGLPGEITKRLEAWAQQNREPLLVAELSADGTKTLRANHQDALLEMAVRLLSGEDARKQILAIGALRGLVSEEQLSNLPKMFDLLAPVCKDPDRKIRPELAELLVGLAQASPKETEFFLQEISRGQPSESAGWLVRQAARALPADSQARLRAATQ